jgi:hypothetical protein
MLNQIISVVQNVFGKNNVSVLNDFNHSDLIAYTDVDVCKDIYVEIRKPFPNRIGSTSIPVLVSWYTEKGEDSLDWTASEYSWQEWLSSGEFEAFLRKTEKEAVPLF